MTADKKLMSPRRRVVMGGAALADDLPEVKWQLVVETPIANASLATTRIALMRSAMQIEYYARSNWTDRAPQMVQTLMVESFENSQRIVSIGRESLGLRSDFVLKTELREFQAEYPFDSGETEVEAGAGAGVAPQTRVALAAKLVQMPRREIVASSTFEGVADAARDDLIAIIESFDMALGRVLKGLVEWTLVNGEINYQRQLQQGNS